MHSDCSLVVSCRAGMGKRGAGDAGEIGRDDPAGGRGPRRPAPRPAADGVGRGCTDRTRAPDAATSDLALLMYTSGHHRRAQGRDADPREPRRQRRGDQQRARASARGDRVLAVLPLYHINAFAVTMLAPLAHGGSLAMPPKFSAGAVLAAGDRRRECTWINVVPTIISYLLEGDAPPRESLAPHPLLPLGLGGAAAGAPPSPSRRSSASASSRPWASPRPSRRPSRTRSIRRCARSGSVGRASGGEARVVDANWCRSARRQHRRDRHPRAARDARATTRTKRPRAAAFTADGWLRTGDLGHRDADGFFFVTGRIKELIIKGGENIAPREIDEVLLAPPRRARRRRRRRARTSTTARRSWPASSCARAAPAARTSCATSASSGSGASRRRASSASSRAAARALGQGAAAEARRPRQGRRARRAACLLPLDQEAEPGADQEAGDHLVEKAEGAVAFAARQVEIARKATTPTAIMPRAMKSWRLRPGLASVGSAWFTARSLVLHLEPRVRRRPSGCGRACRWCSPPHPAFPSD